MTFASLLAPIQARLAQWVPRRAHRHSYDGQFCNCADYHGPCDPLLEREATYKADLTRCLALLAAAGQVVEAARTVMAERDHSAATVCEQRVQETLAAFAATLEGG